MIDYAKIQICCANLNELLQKLEASGWTTTGKHDRNTWVIQEYPLTATYQGLKVIFKSENYIELSGSLHKHFQGGKNYLDFSFSDLLQAIIFLHQSIGLNPFTSLIRHVEFGVNISPPFITTEFLPKILNYKGTNFNPMPKQQGVSLGIVCERTQLNIKIYCKKTQYTLPEEVMRIEMKVFKMQYLKSHEIKYLIDLLNPSAWHDFNKQLSEMFAELIIIDDSFDINKLPEAERELIKSWSNPRHLEKLIKKDRKIFEQERRKFRSIIQRNSKDNHQQRIITLIQEKAYLLTAIDDNTFTKFTEFVNLFKNESAYHFYHSINREIWNNSSPSDKSFPDNLKTGHGKNSILSKAIAKQKEVGKIGKEVNEQAPIKKEVKKERQPGVTTPPKIPEPLKTALPENWDSLISELKNFFDSVELPAPPVKLNGHTTIHDVPKFISGHMATVIHNKGNRTFEPYLERMMQLKLILSEGN